MKDCKRSRRMLIRMMCFGVVCVLEVRDGKKLDTVYVEFSRGQLIVYSNPINSQDQHLIACLSSVF